MRIAVYDLDILSWSQDTNQPELESNSKVNGPGPRGRGLEHSLDGEIPGKQNLDIEYPHEFPSDICKAKSSAACSRVVSNQPVTACFHPHPAVPLRCSLLYFCRTRVVAVSSAFANSVELCNLWLDFSRPGASESRAAEISKRFVSICD